MLEQQTAMTAEERLARRELAAKQKRKKKRTRLIITWTVVLLLCGGAYYGIWSLFQDEKVEQVPWSDFVYRGSIQSVVEGGGMAKAKAAESITLSAEGTVQEVFVSEGDFVNIGDPLYTVVSEDAQENVKEAEEAVKTAEKAIVTAQEGVTDVEEDLADAQNGYGKLSTTAPFRGKLLEVADLKIGDSLSEGTPVATLVDDTTMELELYFSYAYETAIYIGQPAQISIPSTMDAVTGKVIAIHKVERISDQGSKLFAVTLELPNPGTLAQDIGASAILTGSDGNPIYPYEPATLSYRNVQEITASASGKIASLNLRDYAVVGRGTALVTVTSESVDEQLEQLQDTLKAAQEGVTQAEADLVTAQENLVRAQEGLSSYNGVASIAGRVMSMSLMPGETVEAGRVAISIADTSIMTVEAQIDEMNISYVKPGMMADITVRGMDGDLMLMGTVESVSLEGNSENGYATFPAVIKVDNPMGDLMSGMNVRYSLLASQSEDCLLVPQQAVKYTQVGTVVFVKGEAPEGALTEADINGVALEDNSEMGMPGPTQGGMTIPEGFYPVAVTVGLSDQTNAEITSGLEEGQEVFIQYMTDQGDSFSDGMMGGAVMVG